MRILFFTIIILIETTCFAQTKYKLQLGGAAASSGITSTSFFVTGEKRFDLNKGIKLGIGGSIVFYSLPQNYVKPFYEEFYRGQIDNEVPLDSIKTFDINLNSLVIPVGYSFYLSPKFYLDYTLEINLIRSTTFNTIDPNDNDRYEDHLMDNTFFKKGFISHNIAAYRIFWRRCEFGLGAQFTFKRSIVKNGSNQFENVFNDAFSKYAGAFMAFRYYFYQQKATDI